MVKLTAANPAHMPLLEAIAGAINHGQDQKLDEMLTAYKTLAILNSPRGTPPDYDALDRCEDRARHLVEFVRAYNG